MVLTSVESKINILQDGELINPGPISVTTENAITTQLNQFNVPASSVDLAIPIGSKGTIKQIVITASTAVTDGLSVKINGGSEEWAVKPIQEFSQNLTSLTISNTSTTLNRTVDILIVSTE